MKVLLIGMDGCHEEVFKRGWTPFVADRVQTMRQLSIDTDLISRGWLEIALGVHGKSTRAVYDRPKIDGSYGWTKQFSLPDVPGLGSVVKPIWQVLNERGYSVGVLNVPTTFPAAEVNGFFVSGGGGGAPVVKYPTAELCYPEKILPDLLDYGYIVDERMYELVVDSKLSTAAEILRRLATKNERRTDSFIELSKSYQPDFGFLVYRTASVVAESLLMGEYSRRRNAENTPDSLTVQAAEEYYRNFDAQVRKLAETFPDTEIVFVADHGTSIVTHKLNPNILLQEGGLQRKSKSKSSLKNTVASVKKIIPFWLKSYLKKTSLKKIDNLSGISFDPKNSLAFCKTVENWNSGIFINDQKRFGGPVADQDFEYVKRSVLSHLRDNDEVKFHGIKVYDPFHKDGHRCDYFPDIVLQAPNGYLFDDSASDFVQDFVPSRSESSLSSIMQGEILYMKSHSPIALFNRELTERFDDAELSGDLTVVYERILDFYEVPEDGRHPS